MAMYPEDHQKHMSRCLELAALGRERVYPNPMVGSVILHEQRVIAEGFHECFGGPHAEVNAIKALGEPENLSGATLYVNLEPCNHYGKTPPCSELIIESGIPAVVIGTVDPNPLVSGTGIKALKAAGIEVYVGILEDECRALNAKYFADHECRGK